MNNNRQVDQYDNNHLSGFFAGLLLGSLLGAGAMFLLAPKSGKQTRIAIRRTGKELRDHTAEIVEAGLEQVRTKAEQIKHTVQEQAEELQKHGQDVVDGQKERWGPVVEAGKTAVNNT